MELPSMSIQKYIILTIIGLPIISCEDPNPTYLVSKCCPPGYGLMENHTCEVSSMAGPMKPPIHIDDVNEISMTVENDNIWNSSFCESGQIVMQVPLGEETQLHLFDDLIYLYWLSPDTEDWELVDFFCVDLPPASSNTETSNYIVEFCYIDPVLQWRKDELACQNRTCIRKCCPEEHIFNSSCQLPENNVHWVPTFYSSENLSVVVQDPTDLWIVHGIPQCPESLIYDEYVLLDSGKLEMPDYPRDILLENYCLDFFANETGGGTEKLVLCHFEEEQSCYWRHLVVDTIFMSISCAFLAITWIIYVCIAELRTNTFGRCLISFISSLFVTFVCILVRNNHGHPFSDFSCSFTAVITHMTILATFFWLSALSHHIWDCLRSGKKRNETKIFVFYSIYGWGCPLIIGIIGVILDKAEAEAIRPDFLSSPHCWFKDRTTKWAYLYGFKMALLLVNLAFFISSVVFVAKRLRQTQDMRYHSDGLWLYLKLFIIMGITWMIEMITWLIEENNCVTWVTVLDGITALHGVYIFLVTVIFRSDLNVYRRCCRKTRYDVDGNTVSYTRDNFVELLNDQTK